MKFVEALLASLAVPAFADTDPSMLYKFVPQQNWAQHIDYSAIGGYYPANEAELVYYYTQT
jgi:hypothetical protein